MVPELNYSEVNADDYTWLDLNFYEQTTNELKRLEFYVIADVEPDIEDLGKGQRNSEDRYFSRFFSSHSRETAAQCFHYKNLELNDYTETQFGSKYKEFFYIEFVSVASDHSTVLSTLISPEAFFDSPPWHNESYFPPDTSIEKLHEEHSHRITEFIESNPNQQFTRLSSFEELEIFFREDRRKTNEWRKQRGGVTLEELLRFGKEVDLERETQQMADAMERDGLLGNDNDR